MEQRKQALVVHDDPDVIDMVRQALQQKGYQILTARNGLEGYRLFTSNLVSLVILDIMMPGRDGYSLCRDLRAISSVPIILVTDRQNENDVRRGLDLGADDVMRVPFDTPQFLVSLQGVLSLTAERQEYNFQSREVRIGILRHITVLAKSNGAD